MAEESSSTLSVSENFVDDLGANFSISKFILGNFDPAIHSSEDVARAHCVTYETLLESQENQILGVVHIGDLSGISTAHVNAWNPTDFMR